MLDSCVSFLGNCISHKIVGASASASPASGSRPGRLRFSLMSVICATRMSNCSGFLRCLREGVRLIGLEPMTPRLSSACSNQLSYSRVDVERKGRGACRNPAVCGVDLRSSCDLLLHRKEVIQPQVPLRLPCYDFIPVTSLALGPCLLAVGS